MNALRLDTDWTRRAFRKKLSLERRREIAYHEAGHAVAYELFGDKVEHINMLGSELANAFVRRLMYISPWDEIAAISENSPDLAKSMATVETIKCLAGPFAGAFVTEYQETWFDDLLDEWWSEGGQHMDLGKALRCGQSLMGGEIEGDIPRSIYRFIKQRSKWTEELLSMPEVWSVVDALGKVLVRREFVEGDEVRRIIQKAWGANREFGIGEFGRKWKRRL